MASINLLSEQSDELRAVFRIKLKKSPSKLTDVSQQVFNRSISHVCNTCEMVKAIEDFKINRGYLNAECLSCYRERYRIYAQEYRAGLRPRKEV